MLAGAAIVSFVAAALAPEFASAADRPLGPTVHRTGALLREIDDPSSGDRWLLVRDANHPGGPGRLVRVGSVLPSEGERAGQPAHVALLPVIHAGDRVQLEEHSPVVDAVFESVALGAAVAGDSVQVRLMIGGRVVRAIATAPGRAALAAETEAQP